MQLEPSGFSAVAPAPIYKVDRTVGVLLLVLSAISIPLTIIGMFAKTVIFSHFLGHASRAHGALGLLHTLQTIGLLCGLVYAGYAISRSNRQGFLVALVIGAASILLHVDYHLALCAVVYAAIRLFAGVGPRLN